MRGSTAGGISGIEARLSAADEGRTTSEDCDDVEGLTLRALGVKTLRLAGGSGGGVDGGRGRKGGGSDGGRGTSPYFDFAPTPELARS